MSKTQFDIEHVLKLEAVFNNPLAGLIILNKNGEVESINQAMADELGKSQNSLEGTSIKKFLNKKTKLKKITCLTNQKKKQSKKNLKKRKL